ncbi:long-chain fatty acid--CoA ligase [Paenarthrobacter nitroguajacolicus]|uniref:long-chain fatty acid--CoA ligase n=1 Tax=Paenarthrobacter nitroguajacolicus TaxID=211146 RepID=UPI00248B85F4|nr:long-chain fatty acid--CoA ligase [Paenarthrobacter nitroguajacolicus]MDI2033543.1 Long-chain-fatty-acid--CoA ligase [Paenarthrobacter nitroguajacolicus]
MRGLMQDHSLSTPMLVERLEGIFAHKTVVTGAHPQRESATYGEVARRTRKLAGALDAMAVPRSARVATMGWNSQRHFELYLAVPSSGRVLHTINHRLAPADIQYIVNDAQDDVIFVDRSLLDVLWPIVDELPTLRHIVVMDDCDKPSLPQDPRILDYESILGDANGVEVFDVRDERTAAALCYTSGTTGRPKGVLYDHRSIVLHAMSLLFADIFALGEGDVVMPIVPMFHANAWGLPYAAAMCGASLVLPGRAMAPEKLADLLERERVTVSAAVTTVWKGLLPHLHGRDLSTLRKLANGGSPLPVDLVRQYLDGVDVALVGTWGMTEASPLLTSSRMPPGGSQGADGHASDTALATMCAPGYPSPMVKIRVVRPDGTIAPHDGNETGELQVCGATVAGGYFGASDGSEAFTSDGWLKTGDVGTIDPDGCVHVVDRLKDLIKSGGEWIVSTELENAILSHPHVWEAAVVGMPDEKWGERPVAYVSPRQNAAVTAESVRSHLEGKVAKWWIPERVVIVTDIPKTSTGKIAKRTLRETRFTAEGESQ